MIVLEHPHLGLRHSMSADDLALVNYARPRFERLADVDTPHGRGLAALFSIDGALFDGECIMVPVMTNKGRQISALQAESLADHFLQTTIASAKQAASYDPDAGVYADVIGRGDERPMSSDMRVKLERILEDKSRGH
jgi:hypothetical protein